MIVVLLMFIYGAIMLVLGRIDLLNSICVALPLMYVLVLIKSLLASLKANNELVDKTCSLKLENELMEFR
ncbi:MAG TPA: hypothetical protein VMF29_04220, partial [Candidatus Edwardsbacteria bacterium]|nr:hypothetical protein [Candidatus Edwardsbacteria bacterium]